MGGSGGGRYFALLYRSHGMPGGCINGGGQPRCTEENYREKRSKALTARMKRAVAQIP